MLCIVVAALIWVYPGVRTLPDFSLSLQFVWSTAALWSMAFGIGRRERLGAPSPNYWDEGMSFNCRSLGLYIVQQTLASRRPRAKERFLSSEHGYRLS